MVSCAAAGDLDWGFLDNIVEISDQMGRLLGNCFLLDRIKNNYLKLQAVSKRLLFKFCIRVLKVAQRY